MAGRPNVLQWRKGAGPGKGMGPRPLGPSASRSLNTRAEGQGGPVITYPTMGSKVLWVSPGVHLQVFISGKPLSLPGPQSLYL